MPSIKILATAVTAALTIGFSQYAFAQNTTAPVQSEAQQPIKIQMLPPEQEKPIKIQMQALEPEPQVQAPQQGGSTLGLEVFKNLTDVRDMIEVPDGPFHAVESEKGDILFVSASGRWVIGGLAFDIWNKKQLKSVNDMRQSFTHIDLRSMGVDVNELKPIDIGTGFKDVILFVDPNCGWCHKLIEEIRSDVSLQKDYRFRLLFIPALGKVSYDKVKTMYCSSETDKNRLLDAVKNGTELKLPQKPICEVKQLDKRIMTAAAMGVKGVPFVVAHDGRFTRGKPDDLRAWLEQGEAETQKQAQQYREAIKRAAKKLMQQQSEAQKQERAMTELPASPTPPVVDK